MILSAYGAIQEAPFAMGFSTFLLCLAMLMEFIGAIVILIYGVEESKILTNDLREVFLSLIYRMDQDPRANRILKIVQEYVECCGANGSEDYINHYKPVPYECRDMVKGTEFRYGCAQQFAWWLEPWSATLAGVCIFLLLVHVAQLVLSFKIIKQTRHYQRTYSYEN